MLGSWTPGWNSCHARQEPARGFLFAQLIEGLGHVEAEWERVTRVGVLHLGRRHVAIEPRDRIGVRIEDNILITKDGCENLSEDVPKAVAEVEHVIAEGRATREPLLA